MGSLYKPSTKDADGNPLVYKSGANVGQARANYFLAIAVPKQGETHWSQTEWGALIYQEGTHHIVPNAFKSPTFAWKITDGDDQTPNGRGKRACDAEGFPGNWILRFSGSFAPKVYREENGAYVQVTEENYIKPGYYVQISGSVSPNASKQNPGLYLNHSMVAMAAYGPEIHFGPDANSVGFGQAPLPAGASASPLASGLPVPATSSASVANSAGVVPNPQFLNVPPPPPPSAPKMTAKAQGASYQSYKTAGWTDEALVAQGYLVTA